LFAFIPVVIAHVGAGVQMLGCQDDLRAYCHGGQLVLVRYVIGDFMRHDEFRLMIYGDLHVVTDTDTVFGLHRSTIRIGQ